MALLSPLTLLYFLLFHSTYYSLTYTIYILIVFIVHDCLTLEYKHLGHRDLCLLSSLSISRAWKSASYMVGTQ